MPPGALATGESPGGPTHPETPDHSTSPAGPVPRAAYPAQPPADSYRRCLTGTRFRGAGFRLELQSARNWACPFGSLRAPRARTRVSRGGEIRRYQCRHRVVTALAGPID